MAKLEPQRDVQTELMKKNWRARVLIEPFCRLAVRR